MRWVVLGLLLGVAAPAAAEEPDLVAFDSLAVQAREPELSVTYRVAAKSWSSIAARHLEPVLVLDVRLPGGRSERKQIALTAAEGTASVKLSNYRTVDTVDVSLGGRLILGLGDTQVHSARLRVFR